VPAGGSSAAFDGSPANTAASCELDISCYRSYAQLAAGVAQYSFVDDSGVAYLCSGALLNTNSGLPYLLTANHCVSTDSEARTVEAEFLYHTASCNGTPPDLSAVPKLEGARFLAGSPDQAGRLHADAAQRQRARWDDSAGMEHG